ncbi:ecotropic viral integration site 5 ortholog-like isoform X4 [Ostrea edulis]|uniref:ecotropic viral integration site 5 ortholog-like isoform X4 n=1 Tax=Ostrea edulis TaxID=37623 RepID=UPI0024AF30D5|nr:ecotropic viral integration site 5 ortholog-like isoform X4 [Ostrea edulis]XP_056012325.1 ecotropic viral integration site 5 ortholog-like isoform X4 [Ostrea edulis]XP_056012326.1 ecotropic viral integration site 5 ortholog-like isoform X4 [Ostrea edulis]XP_056012327.1 ecotropic viral integration site 5 ortholog-like isoform X4 [Ostrea edulis]
MSNTEVPVSSISEVPDAPVPSQTDSPETQQVPPKLEREDNQNKDETAELLARLEEANKLLEADEKSLVSLNVAPSPTPSHSRKGSGSSVVSTTSSNSHYSNQQSTEEADSNTATGNVWEIWGKLVNDWDNAKKKTSLIKELVRRGIPHHFRGLAWQLLLGVHDSPHKQLYVEYLKQTSPSEKLIRRDIARTFPDHDFFKEKDGLGQESLFNVMKAYSLHDREVGYCQGSGFIVGLLLMQMPEEEAFAVLVKLMQDYRLRELFKPSMAELGLCMYKLECLIQELLPDMYLHFQSQGFHTSMYASSWFLTLFATSFSLSLSCRVMDLFISEGMDVIFRLGIAILQTSQEEILSMDMEGMLQHFPKTMFSQYEGNPDRLFNTAFAVKYSAKKMKKIEKEYTALKSKENEEQIELRRLRTENRLLRQRIEALEKESASLADRLIQYQVTRAQEAEETYALKNNLSTTKQKLVDTTRKLEEANTLIGDIKHRTSSITSASSLDEDEAQTVIQHLQEELIALRLKDADTDSLVKELRTKIKELEETNLQLQKAPSNDVQHLQEELIAVKLREAEANLSLKEMKHKVYDLESQWEDYIVKSNEDPSSPKDKNSNKHEIRQLQEEVMSVKIKETACMSELKETKQKVMEFETQNHICTNQIRRMDEENKTLKSQIEIHEAQEKDLGSQIKDLSRKLDNLEAQRKEESMMMRIRDAEQAQSLAELKRKIAELEIQKEELLTADRLDAKDGSQDLANQIYDLQDEVLQLRLSHNSSTPRASYRNGSLSESEDESDEDLENPETLNRTLSDIIEGKSPTSVLSSSLINSPSPKNSTTKSSIESHLMKGGQISEEDQCIEALSPISSPSKVPGSNLNGNCDTQLGQSDNGALLNTSQTMNGTGAVVDSESCREFSSGATNGELVNNQPTVTSSEGSIRDNVL